MAESTTETRDAAADLVLGKLGPIDQMMLLARLSKIQGETAPPPPLALPGPVGPLPLPPGGAGPLGPPGLPIGLPSRVRCRCRFMGLSTPLKKSLETNQRRLSGRDANLGLGEPNGRSQQSRWIKPDAQGRGILADTHHGGHRNGKNG